jgi:uncharacterized protein
MSTSMYQNSVPTIKRALTNLIAVLEKGAAHAEAKKIDPSVFVNARLYPDMFPLVKQIQIAADVSRIGCARLAQVEPPKAEDNEKTFPEMIERLKSTIGYLDTLKPAQIDGAEERTVTWTAQEKTHSMPGMNYLHWRILPNVFFHCATAYNILRHNGVEVGKTDFLGKLTA